MSEKKEKKKKIGKRQERRFLPQSGHNPWLVRIAGAVGAAGLGAGAYAYVYGQAFEGDEKLRPIPSYLIAGGAIFTGVAIWLGTSSDPPVRVGQPGIAIERGETRRMPWWAIAQISWEGGSGALVVSGKDEAGIPWTFKVSKSSHPDAVGWILEEADKRIPKVLDVSESARSEIPQASDHAGTKIDLEPLQVVGKKCAKTGKTISYEPDARICTRCERVYLKSALPKKCKCGASLAHLQGSADEAVSDEDAAETSEHEAQEEEATS